MGFGWTIVALIAVLAVAWRFLGSYMAAVFEGRVRWLSFIERPVYRLLGVDPESVQSWRCRPGFPAHPVVQSSTRAAYAPPRAGPSPRGTAWA